MLFGRRKFIRDFSLATAGFAIAPNLLRGDDDEASKLPESRKIFKDGGEPVRLGFVGTGLMGGENMRQFKRLGQLISAYCDVDTKYGFGKARKFAEKGAPYFVDYREMFEKMRGKLDGIVISTPDHSHYAAAICALRHGFPIYLEKPMCHTIWQIRELAKFAKERNSITQMGNIVHAGDGIRICWEWINAGLIGKVRRVVIWTDRPLSKSCNQRPGAYLSWPPSEEVPPELDWDKWQNVESVQGFSSKLHPLNWRRFWKYGTGSLGDIGCHMLDVPISALELGYPKKVVARSRGVTEISVSLQDNVTYYFEKSSQGVPVTIDWYSGFLKRGADGKYEKDYDQSFLPPLPDQYLARGKGYEDLSDNGMFIIGDEGVLYSPTMHLFGKPVLLSGKKFNPRDIAASRPRIRQGDLRLNFVDGIRGDVAKTCSNFEEAKVLTEIVALGNLALQLGEPIVWDIKNMKCVGLERADALIKTPMRDGWC